ncbi:MAG: hypothetical protein L6V88_10845 [Anaerotruncus sp.]|nr:MAG: hypothetical protein L6V88_10845 [Anaerotruncus sp.]
MNHGAGTAIFRPVINTAGAYVLTLLIHKQFTRNEEYLQVVVNGKVHEVFFPKNECTKPNGQSAADYPPARRRKTKLCSETLLKTRADSSFYSISKNGQCP